MKFVYRQLIWKQEGGMNLKREERNFLFMETKERRSSREMEERMLRSRKREINSHVNTIKNMAMMKTIVGNFILKRDPKSSTIRGNQRLLQP
jgi:hypothetical protein